MVAGTAGSRPDDERLCHPCRRLRLLASATPQRTISCAHPACQATIVTGRQDRKYCSRQCSQRAVDASPAARARWGRKNAKRRPDVVPGAAYKWQILRARVLAEEKNCWICGDEIDMTLPGLHTMGPTGDHVVPLSDGGALLERDNVRAAHNICNRRRHIRYRQQKRMETRRR